MGLENVARLQKHKKCRQLFLFSTVKLQLELLTFCSSLSCLVACLGAQSSQLIRERYGW